MKKKKLKHIPKFKTYEEELDFWRTHNLDDYLDFSRQTKKQYQKNLKQRITVRFSIEDLTQLRKIAAKKGMGVTTFIRLKMRTYLKNKTNPLGL